MILQRFHSVADVVARFFPSRSERWVKDTFRAGDYGPVLRDSSGWHVSEVAIGEFQRRHAVGENIVALRPEQSVNLVQSCKSSRV